MNTAQIYNYYRISGLLSLNEEILEQFVFLREILEKINGNSTVTIKVNNIIEATILSFKPDLIKGMIHQKETDWKGISDEKIFVIDNTNSIQIIESEEQNLSILKLLEQNKRLYSSKILVIVSNNTWYDSKENHVKESTLINIYVIPKKKIENLISTSSYTKDVLIDLSDMIGIDNGLNGSNIFRIERFEFLSKFIFYVFTTDLKDIMKNTEKDSLFFNLNEICINIHLNKNNFILTIKGIEIMSEITFYGNLTDNSTIGFREVYGSLDEINLMIDYFIQIWNNPDINIKEKQI